MTDVPALIIYVQVRLLLPTGEVQLIPFNFTPQNTYAWYPAYFVPPVEGYLLSAQCWAQNPERGRCFVSVQLMRSAPPDLQSSGEIVLQGYISYMCALSYPGSPIESCFSGRGAFVTQTLANLTGANALFGTSQYTLWKVNRITFLLTTSAAAGNRTVTFITQDVSGNRTGLWPCANSQGPGTTNVYTFTPGGVTGSIGSWQTVAGPTELFLPPQSSMQTEIMNLDIADQLTGIYLLVEEWMGL